MKNSTRTIYGSYLQAVQSRQAPFSVIPNSTLNEKLLILDDYELTDDQIPRINYIGIGIGGHYSLPGQEGIPVTRYNLFNPRFASLYKQMPFVLRAVGDDIPVASRSKYRLRKLVEINGEMFIAYYLKIISDVATTPTINYMSKQDGDYQTLPFQPSADNLNPTPPTISNYETNYTDSNYYVVSDVVEFVMTKDDINEYINVARIMFGSEEYAIISEIGVFSGVDVVRAPLPNTDNVEYKEVVACQLNAYLAAKEDISYATTDLSMAIDLGDIDPLIDISTATTV